MEENPGEADMEYGAARMQKGLSHKVAFEKGPKEVREQVNVRIWGREFLHRGSQSAKARQEHSEWTGGTARRPVWLKLNE